MGLRRVREEATSLRKEGVVLNGTAKVIWSLIVSWGILIAISPQAKTLEEATLIGAMLEIFGLGSFFRGDSREAAVEGLPEDDDAIDTVARAPSKTRSGLVLWPGFWLCGHGLGLAPAVVVYDAFFFFSINIGHSSNVLS